MTTKPLGLVKVSTPGTPVPLTTSTAITASKMFFQVVPGLTGKTYIGTAGMNKTTLAGVVRILWPNSSGGASENFSMDSMTGTDVFRPSDIYIDADVAGEGVLVTYWQE